MVKKKLDISIIDMDILYNVFGNNSAAIVEYLNSFVKVTSELLSKVQADIQKKNVQATLDYFHQLKGPIGTIGFKKMYNLCEKLEFEIARLDWNAVDKLYRDLEKALKELDIEIKKRFKDN